MEEIKNTLVEDRKAIQKVALIDVSNHYAWDVLAFDRTEPGGITVYFKEFLQVVEREDAFKLTEKAISSTRLWAVNNKDIIDPDQDISSYKSRAIDYLNTNEIFNSDVFIESVIYDEDFNRKRKLKKSFKDFLTEQGLYGQTFHPSKAAISKKAKKNIRFTSEGLKLEWTGDAKDVNIEIPKVRDENDGMFHILIKTIGIIETS